MIDLTISISIAEAHAKAEHDDVARCRSDSYLHVLECIKRLVVKQRKSKPFNPYLNARLEIDSTATDVGPRIHLIIGIR